MSYYSDKFIDYSKREIEVKWTKDTWDNHLNKHPELTDMKQASVLINETLSDPSLVMEGDTIRNGKEEKIRCYYKEHKRHQDWVTYSKVVVGYNADPSYIKSVWKKEAVHYLIVQERKYNFKEIWKKTNSYL